MKAWETEAGGITIATRPPKNLCFPSSILRNDAGVVAGMPEQAGWVVVCEVRPKVARLEDIR